MAYTTINKPSEHFNTTVWTGDSTTPKTFTTGTFKPDLHISSNRSQAYNQLVYDTTRGAGNNKELYGSDNVAEGAGNTEIYGYLSAFTSTGFTFTRGTDAAGDDYFNESPDEYVAWTWKANGGTTSSNTDGSITSTVQANTTAGFSIVKYTGTGSNATLGHGLSTVPKMIIVKNLDQNDDWYVYHVSTGSTRHLILNSEGTGGSNSTLWQDTDPTSSVFSIGTNNVVNTSGEDYIAYCFAEKKGFSKMGSFEGNGSTDGTFIYTGFKPAFVLIKNFDALKHWIIFDNKRTNTFNPTDTRLLFNNTGVDYTSSTRAVDFLSNGFKMRDNGTDSSAANTSGNTHLYYAVAEASIVGTNNVPATAK